MIEDLIHACVQDVFGVPVYIVPTSDLPVPAEFLSAGAVGMSGTKLDLELQSHLESCDLWRGRGPAIVVDDDRSDDEIIATVIHEMAHALEGPFDLEEPTYREIEAASDVGMIGRSLWSNFSELNLPRFFGHELPFIRNCLHLQHRFARAGADTPLDLIVDGAEYDISDSAVYQDALGDEPCRFLNELFSSIREIRPPQDFIDLWRSDVLASMKSRTDWPQQWTEIHVNELHKYLRS
jgi:hypothetical protein